ncbi:Pyrrolo-quinoline quinone [Verrucomicrobia bacterium]|nr:Pyrrolo-quinoline quinone [Verrucomicrobiota bacterium]
MRAFLAKSPFVLPALVAIAALAFLVTWLGPGTDRGLTLRVPGTDQAPTGGATGTSNPVLAGKLVRSDGTPSDLPGVWPRFRGPDGDAISKEAIPLLRSWAASGPRQLWSVEVGEGFAGAAVWTGRVYVMDYDRDHKQDALRCLSLADGREIWRFCYPVVVKRNHGMSRTVPAVTDRLVVGLGPKCHVVCLNPVTGELRWGLDLVRQYGTTVPPWYAGQCPLVDKGSLILAPAGKDALLVALDGETGVELWRTPNPHGWKMTHSSVVPAEFEGERMYVYCASEGVVGVSARNGSILWECPDWKISFATVPSPVSLDGGRIFLSGGYGAGSLMLQLKKENGRLVAQTAFRLPPEVFGATQHTPILYGNHLYGVRADGKFVCLSTDGKVVWTSAMGQPFGLGSFILADGVLLAMNDSGLLRLIEATPDQYHLLAQAQVLNGHESWGPLALAGGRLIARDLTRMVCLDVGRR